MGHKLSKFRFATKQPWKSIVKWVRNSISSSLGKFCIPEAPKIFSACTWAVAGRSRSKLEAVLQEMSNDLAIDLCSHRYRRCGRRVIFAKNGLAVSGAYPMLFRFYNETVVRACKSAAAGNTWCIPDIDIGQVVAQRKMLSTSESKARRSTPYGTTCVTVLLSAYCIDHSVWINWEEFYYINFVFRGGVLTPSSSGFS